MKRDHVGRRERRHAEPADTDKRERILAAAKSLFLRYGVRRSSMDDVAREAGIAKGTVYLYFPSKDALFAALAEDLSRHVLARGVEAMGAATSHTSALVEFLDVVIGEPNRLLATSPHAGELLQSKAAYAAPAMAHFHGEIQRLVSERLVVADIRNKRATEMIIAAGFGALKTGDLASDQYRGRLQAIIAVLLRGLAE